MPESTAPSPAFLDAFRCKAGADEWLPFDRFMALALYDPAVGYYRQSRPRVGRGKGTDFYTATSSPLFGELVCAASMQLLADKNLQNYEFVEIGAEPAGGVLAAVKHPFGAVRTIRVGEPIALQGQCVVFSNELFDAQPFRRFVFREKCWRELGVQLRENELADIEIETSAPLPTQLPASAPEGYHLDLPLASIDVITQIAIQPWAGLFLAFDYGKSWRELTEVTPAGTARAYFQHTQSNDLLARPGDQDLTCHICWDWLADALQQNRFESPCVESQEAFFIRHAADFIAAFTTAEAARFSAKKLSLLQLLHPTHMGQKFQALRAVRHEFRPV